MKKIDSLRIANIDFLRGIAAIVILFWHYAHFYSGSSIKEQIFPGYSLFKAFYTKGYFGVKFFWMLSGFVFFHVYKSQRNISLSNFSINRFSRLYPLHFITLLIVAILQIISLKIFNVFQIAHYCYDAKHFFLQLFMASDWITNGSYSFNGPIWSVSVEILVYFMFFSFLKSFGISLKTSIGWFVWSLIVYKNSKVPLLQCALLFSAGGMIHQFHSFLKLKEINCVVLSVILIVLALFLTKILPFKESFIIFWFGIIIFTSVSLEDINVSFGKFGIFLGNLTYASYLIHVPLQIIAIMILDGLIGSRDILKTNAFLGFYIFGTLFLSYFVYNYIELPLHINLKNRFKPK